jgi:hypothetical protein
MDVLIAVFRSAVVGAAMAGLASHGIAQVVSVPAALLSHAEGGVAVAPKGDTEWTDVKPRRALQRGDRVWVDKGARAELLAGSHLLRIDGQSQVSLDAVGDGTQLSLLRGSLALAVSRLAPGENVEIGTPNLALRARQLGDYRVDVDPQQGTTRVSVMSGSVVVYGEHGESVDVMAGQRLTFRERTLAKAPTPAFAAVDDFDRWIVARGRAPAAAPTAQTPPAVHPDTIARMHREQEAQRQAQVKRELEQLKQAQAKLAPAAPAAPKIVQVPPAAPAPAPVARIDPAPRVVKVPAPAAAPAVPDAKALAARRADEERRTAQARRAQEQQRKAAAEAVARKADEQRRAAAVAALNAKRELEQQRRNAVAQARKAEQERKQQLARKAEQDRKVALAKRAQEQALKAAAHQQALGEARRAQLEKLQQQAMREEQATREQRTRAEQARREEESRREELARREEEAKREAWERRQRVLAEQQKRDHDVWLRTQQPIQVQPYRPAPQGVPARRVM